MIEPAGERPIRALVTNDMSDYPHNDVANAAWFFMERARKSFDENDRRDGIFLDMMALVTMTAFALEGYVNFVGARLIEQEQDATKAAEQWACFERKRIKQKIKIVRRLTGMAIDWNKRPYLTVGELIDLRNMFAHPKAHRPAKREFEAVGTESELRKILRDYRTEYERLLTWDFAKKAYEDVEQIWTELLATAKIEVHETWSGGMQGLEYLSDAEDSA